MSKKKDDIYRCAFFVLIDKFKEKPYTLLTNLEITYKRVFFGSLYPGIEIFDNDIPHFLTCVKPLDIYHKIFSIIDRTYINAETEIERSEEIKLYPNEEIRLVYFYFKYFGYIAFVTEDESLKEITPSFDDDSDEDE